MERIIVPDDYTAISLEVIRLDKVAGFDLYLMRPEGPVLYREKNVVFTLKNLRALLENSVRFLYFRNEDHSLFREYIEDNLESIVADKKVPREKKASIIYNISSQLAQEMLIEPDTAKVVRRASKVIDNFIAFTTQSRDVYKDIIKMLPTDYYTHTHSANVATYSLAIGQVLGLSLNSGLWDLTLGALLHDIGKARIPQELLYKETPLTADEFEIIKKHVEYGVEIAGNTNTVSKDSLLVIAQHHERLSGSGYPKGITDSHLFSRIVSVADTFDAVTTNRPYANGRTSFEAILLLRSRSDDFDQEIVKSLVHVMADKQSKIRAIV